MVKEIVFALGLIFGANSTALLFVPYLHPHC